MGDGGWRRGRVNQRLVDTNNLRLSSGSRGLLSVCKLFYKSERVLGYTAEAACVVVVCSCWDNGGPVFSIFHSVWRYDQMSDMQLGVTSKMFCGSKGKCGYLFA